jgi:hypothetical protein
MIRDHWQFTILGTIAIALIVGEVILAITGSSPVELHAALLVIIAGLVGVANPSPKPPEGK